MFLLTILFTLCYTYSHSHLTLVGICFCIDFWSFSCFFLEIKFFNSSWASIVRKRLALPESMELDMVPPFESWFAKLKFRNTQRTVVPFVERRLWNVRVPAFGIVVLAEKWWQVALTRSAQPVLWQFVPPLEDWGKRLPKMLEKKINKRRGTTTFVSMYYFTKNLVAVSWKTLLE